MSTSAAAKQSEKIVRLLNIDMPTYVSCRKIYREDG